VTALLAAGGLLDPQELLVKGGYVLLFAIVFAESGLLVGFFLPGDSLLFIAGMASAGTLGRNDIEFNIYIVLIGVFIAAVVGDQVGYLFGNKVGPSIFKRPNSRLFKHENVEKAQAFFDRHGPKAIVLARFVPIVRTFVPVVAGVGRMHYSTFVKYNVLGGFLWAVGVTLLGYFLGNVAIIKDNLEIAILCVVALSLVPIGIEFLRSRRESSATGS
jgi:membrane-associated protein